MSTTETIKRRVYLDVRGVTAQHSVVIAPVDHAGPLLRENGVVATYTATGPRGGRVRFGWVFGDGHVSQPFVG